MYACPGCPYVRPPDPHFHCPNLMKLDKCSLLVHYAAPKCKPNSTCGSRQVAKSASLKMRHWSSNCDEDGYESTDMSLWPRGVLFRFWSPLSHEVSSKVLSWVTVAPVRGQYSESVIDVTRVDISCLQRRDNNKPLINRYNNNNNNTSSSSSSCVYWWMKLIISLIVILVPVKGPELSSLLDQSVLVMRELWSAYIPLCCQFGSVLSRRNC